MYRQQATALEADKQLAGAAELHLRCLLSAQACGDRLAEGLANYRTGRVHVLLEEPAKAIPYLTNYVRSSSLLLLLSYPTPSSRCCLSLLGSFSYNHTHTHTCSYRLLRKWRGKRKDKAAHTPHWQLPTRHWSSQTRFDCTATHKVDPSSNHSATATPHRHTLLTAGCSRAGAVLEDCRRHQQRGSTE